MTIDRSRRSFRVLAVVAAALITGADVTLSGRAVLGDLLALAGGLFAACYVVIVQQPGWCAAVGGCAGQWCPEHRGDEPDVRDDHPRAGG